MRQLNRFFNPLGWMLIFFLIWPSVPQAQPNTAEQLDIFVGNPLHDSGLIQTLAEKFKHKYPQVDISIHILQDQSAQELDQNRTGVYFTPFLLAEMISSGEHNISSEKIFYHDIVVLGPKDDPLGIAKKTTLAQVITEFQNHSSQLILPHSQTFSFQYFAQALKWNNIELQELQKNLGNFSEADTLKMAQENRLYTVIDLLNYQQQRHLLGDLTLLYHKTHSPRVIYYISLLNYQNTYFNKRQIAEKFRELALSHEGQTLIQQHLRHVFNLTLHHPAAHLNLSKTPQGSLQESRWSLYYMILASLAALSMLLYALFNDFRHTKIKQQLWQNTQNNNYLNVILQSTAQAFWYWNFTDKNKYYSRKFFSMLALPQNISGQQNPFDLIRSMVYPAHLAYYNNIIECALANKETCYFCVEFKTQEGTHASTWLNLKGMIQKDTHGQNIYAAGSIENVENKIETDHHLLRIQQETDLASNLLPQQYYLINQVSQYIEKGIKEDENFAIMMLKLQNFKYIKTQFGQDVANLVLQEIDYRLKKNLRKSDSVVCLDENLFCLVLPYIDLRAAATLAEKMIENINENAEFVQIQPLKLTLQIGIAVYPQHGNNYQTLISNAETALDAALQGQQDYCVFDFNLLIHANKTHAEQGTRAS